MERSSTAWWFSTVWHWRCITFHMSNLNEWRVQKNGVFESNPSNLRLKDINDAEEEKETFIFFIHCRDSSRRFVDRDLSIPALLNINDKEMASEIFSMYSFIKWWEWFRWWSVGRQQTILRWHRVFFTFSLFIFSNERFVEDDSMISIAKLLVGFLPHRSSSLNRSRGSRRHHYRLSLSLPSTRFFLEQGRRRWSSDIIRLSTVVWWTYPDTCVFSLSLSVLLVFPLSPRPIQQKSICF